MTVVALQHAYDATAVPLDVDAARAEVERLRAGLPDSLLAARPDELRRLARRALETDLAARRRRAKVGEPPAVDEHAVDVAVAAHAAVRAARAGMTVATAEGMRLLAIGNVWGVAAIGTGAVLLRSGLEPMSTPVYLAVVGAAAGPLATAALGLSRRSFAAMRVAAATASWAEAVAGAGATTMGELGARRIAARAWQRRRDEADAATAAAREARAAWHRVVGPKRHPRDAPALLARLAALRAAQLDLFRALVAERMRPRAAPAPAVDVVDIDGAMREPSRLPVLWAKEQPLVALAPAVAASAESDTPPADSWLGDALTRLRGRGLRLWTKG
ncbi:MAG TPA: hypothetical protein VF230_18035 [Acidimicrobiales bacterium]